MSMPAFNTVLRTTATKAMISQVSRNCLVTRPSLSVATLRELSQFATRHENDAEVKHPLKEPESWVKAYGLPTTTLQILERGKKEILDQHHPNSKVEPTWREEVASDSEAFVKAIRREVKNTGEDIETITKESEKVLKESRIREGHEIKS
ncbi:hypothetical protein EV426DRAFT_704808 [Tirmania nivea]|nr:hypothetical protein EV426DRAFT_704808 [Tirmania nivea]